MNTPTPELHKFSKEPKVSDKNIEAYESRFSDLDLKIKQLNNRISLLHFEILLLVIAIVVVSLI